MEQCPICGGFVKVERQILENRREPGFFNGTYACFQCGSMSACGSIIRGGLNVMAYTPVCDCCNSASPVCKASKVENRWICAKCGRRMAVHGNRLVITPAPHELRPALAI